ncbi:MAG: HAMP domain-containing sensor histidine kinase [Parasphingorhabdus sp.]
MPKSLVGQLLLLVAFTLLIAQSVNIFLLYRGAQDQRLFGASVAAAARIAGELERMDNARYEERRTRRENRRRNRGALPLVSDGPPVLPEAIRLPRIEERAVLAFQNLGADVKSIRAMQTLRIPEALTRSVIGDRRGRSLASEIGRPMGRERKPPSISGYVVLSVELSDGRWISIASALRDNNPRVLRSLLVQTVVLYLILLIPLIWIGKYISRPLRELTGVADNFQPGRRDRVEESGPPDTRRLIVAFNKMNDRVGSMLDEKDVMLGAIGHDLRTPLAALRVRVETVDDDAERERMIAVIEDMDRTLDDILSLARLGRSGESSEATDIRALIETVVDEFVDQGLPATYVRGDRNIVNVRAVLLRRALRNLIGNAIKYGENASISVDKTEDNLCINVDDTGPGIPEQEIPSMFEPFVRAEHSRNKSTGGSGLGLTLARAIARDHGGDVTMQNRPEGGLRAKLILPDIQAGD